MTLREQFAESLQKSGAAYKKAAIAILIAVIILAPLALALKLMKFNNAENILQFIALPFQLFFLYQLYRFISIIFKEVKCSKCGKSMKHLVLDPSYSKKLLFFGPPANIPADVIKCPYCGMLFDS